MDGNNKISSIITTNIDNVYKNMEEPHKKIIDNIIECIEKDCEHFNEDIKKKLRENNEMLYKLTEISIDDIEQYIPKTTVTIDKNKFSNGNAYNCKITYSDDNNININFFVDKIIGEKEHRDDILKKIIRRIHNIYTLYIDSKCMCTKEEVERENDNDDYDEYSDDYNKYNNDYDECENAHIRKDYTINIFLYSNPDRANDNYYDKENYLKKLSEAKCYDMATGLTENNISYISTIEDIMGLINHELIHLFELETYGGYRVKIDDLIINFAECSTNSYASILNAILTSIEETKDIKQCIHYEVMQVFISMVRLFRITGITMETEEKNNRKKIIGLDKLNPSSFLISYIIYRAGFIFDYKKTMEKIKENYGRNLYSFDKKNCSSYYNKCTNIIGNKYNKKIDNEKNEKGNEKLLYYKGKFFYLNEVMKEENKPNMYTFNDFFEVHEMEGHNTDITIRIANKIVSGEFIELCKDIDNWDNKTNNEKKNKGDNICGNMLMLSWALDFLPTDELYENMYGGDDKDKYKNKYIKYKKKYMLIKKKIKK